MYSNNTNVVVSDRLGAIEQAGPDGLAALFEQVPSIAQYAEGRGPIVRFLRDGIAGRRQLAEFLAGQVGLVIAHLDRIELQLLVLCVYRGGLLTRAQARQETELSDDRLDRAAARMATLFLTDPAVELIGLREGVADWVPMPGVTFRNWADNIYNRDLEVMAAAMGIDPGSRKWERVDAIEAALRGRASVESMVDRLDPEVRELFARVLSAGQMSDDALYGEDWSDYSRVFGARNRLLNSGLVGSDGSDMWVWLDVIATLNGGLYQDWRTVEPVPEAPATHHLAASIPPVVSLIDRVLTHIGANPAPALKAGGFGTTAVRAMAKALGARGPEVGMAVALAIELGLLGTVVVATSGRGRRRNEEHEWRISQEAADWRALPAVHRWHQLIDKWASSPRIALVDKPVERWDPGQYRSEPPLVRSLFLSWLAEIPEDSAIGEATAVELLSFRHPLLMPAPIGHELVAEARILGLIDNTEPTAPTPIARALLSGGNLAQLFDRGSTTFVVQADHTVIAPPDLDPDLVSRLGRMALLESNAGAHTYRIDERSLIPAFDAGMAGDEIITFLDDHSSVPIPDTVRRTVTDVADRHGKLAMGSTKTWIACDDPAVISRAAAVKAAKLQVISSTAAVSDLPRTKVMSALRSAGLVPVDTAANSAAAKARIRSKPSATPPEPASFVVDVEAVAQRIWATQEQAGGHHHEIAALEALWHLDDGGIE